MKLERITSWLDRTLDVAAFSDVSNNGIQIDREGDEAERGACDELQILYLLRGNELKNIRADQNACDKVAGNVRQVEDLHEP